MVFVKANVGPPNAGDSEKGVHKKRGVITEYLIRKKEEIIWLSKQDAIKWTIEDKLHAILVHMKNGNYYLRPEHGQHSFVIIT